MLINKVSGIFALKVLFLIAVFGSVQALQETDPSGVGQAEFRSPILNIENTYRLPRDLPAQALANAQADLNALGVRSDSAHVDTRGGRWASLLLAEPLLPGRGKGNGLTWANLGRGAPKNNNEHSQAASQAFREYLEANSHPLRIDLDELAGPGKVTVNRGGASIQIFVPRVFDGVKVRGSHLTANINHGNLILFGTKHWGDINTGTEPGIAEDAAWQTLQAYIEPYPIDSAWGKSELLLVPVARGQDVKNVPVGKGFDYRLAWVIRPAFDGDLRRFEALVDAHTGEILSFEDTNQYAATPREVTGGVLPVSNDGISPDGVEQAGWPMPFDNVSTPGGTVTTDSGGNLPAPVEGNITSTLDGQYVRMNDHCGDISLTSDADIDFGTSGGTDCTTPGDGGAGNTHASRTGFHELNRIVEMGRSHLPANTWLQQQLTSNMNINLTCNAFWSPGAGTVNFYRSGGGCFNTGEIAGVFDHEWGHGLDDNDAIPSIASPSGEGIADIYAALRLNDSCIGRNFRATACTGFGDPCVSVDGDPACTGVRDIDYLKRASGQPHDYTWSNSNCGGSVHCVGSVYSEAVWSLWKRELQDPPYNMDNNTAHEVVNRLTFIGAGATGTWFSGGPPNGGCDGSSGYMNFLAADDNNGNLNDGTPHMQAIFKAFDDQEIACSTPTVQDSGCAGTPTSAPVVTAVASDKSVGLSWGAVTGASSYEVFRTDGVFACDFGKVRIGETTGTSFNDSGLQNDRDYSYVVIPKGSSASCFGRASACATAHTAAGPNVAVDPASAVLATSGGDADLYIDNCEAGTLTFDVNNNGLGSLTNVRITGVTVVSHPGNTTITTSFPAPLSPSTLAEGATGTGSFDFTAGGLSFGDTLVFEVSVTSDEISPVVKTRTLTIENAETDIQVEASKIWDFESDLEDWTLIQGTFNRSSVGGGAGGSSWYTRTSSNLHNQCDQIRSPAMRLTASSTLTVSTNFDIENFSGGSWWDRANVAFFEDGARNSVDPDGGRLYSASGAGAVCVTAGQNGWANSNPTWASSSFSAGALDSAGRAGQTVQIDVAYGTDVAVVGDGFRFDQLTVTDVEFLVADGQSDSCSVCTLDSECNDGAFCNGVETCNVGTGICEAGTTVDCSDDASCTDDTCNEATDSCDNVANDANCANGLFCDGAETCDAVNDCQAGAPVDCNDSVGCTVDSCNEGTDSCDNVPDDGVCDNGVFCDGAEICDVFNDCQPSSPPSCDDGVGCTDDSCNASTDVCDNVANDGNCNDGAFCNGAETCDEVLDCQSYDPCPGQSCDEDGDVCIGPDSSVHVASVVTGTQNASKGFKYGTATVTVVDNDGNPPGTEYTVSGAFGGSFNDMPSGDTDGGVVTFTTDTSKKGVTVTFCVADVVGDLPYEPIYNGIEVTTCGALPICGDNLAEGSEVCDGSDLRGESCTSLGYESGTLACLGDCSAYNTALCDGEPPTPECVPTHSKEKGPRCSDGLDNDCDELIDGADPDC